MTYVTPTRAAAGAAALAVLGSWLSPVLGFYLTLVACAGLMGASLQAYLEVVDAPDPARVVELAACSVAGLLLVVDASIRFPALLGPTAPPAAAKLAQVAFGLTIAAVLTPAVAAACTRMVPASWRRQTRDTAGRVSHRSARLIRRIVDVT
jgi:hypothetical protein